MRRPYTAPERIAGGAWDRRADVFSLAALMHELLWGRRRDGDRRAGGRRADRAAGRAISRALRDVFARALAEDPADRFETALEFATALQARLHGIAAPDAAIVAPRVGRRHRRSADADDSEAAWTRRSLTMTLARVDDPTDRRRSHASRRAGAELPTTARARRACRSRDLSRLDDRSRCVDVDARPPAMPRCGAGYDLAAG